MADVIYKYDKKADTLLHKAAFRGKMDKVKLLLQLNSPYKTTSDRQTPLHLSLSKGHQNVANIFLDIFETDLTAARQFLKKHEIKLTSKNENFVFALGKSQIEMVRRNCSEMMLNQQIEGESIAYAKSTFVLMKENSFSIPEVLVLHPHSEEQKFKILLTAFQLMKQNGVISLNVARSDDRCSALHVASARGYTDIVMKLLELGADPYIKDWANQTAMGSAHSMGEFPTYAAMCHHLNLNMLEPKGFVRLPISNAVWDKVQFLIETLVTLRMEKFAEGRETAIRSILAMNEIGQTFLLSNIGEKCLEIYGDYLQDKKVSKIISLIVNFANQNTELVMRFIRKDCMIVKQKTTRVIQYKTHNTVLHSLVRNGWNNEIREIYREFPRLKDVLFAHKELGLNALVQCIQSNHIDLAEFLIQEHEVEINRPEYWSQLLIAASELNGSLDFTKMILNHRMTDPNLILNSDQCTHTNALFVCISKGNLEKLEIILASEKLTNLNIIKDKFDVTLLQSSIFSLRKVDPPSGIYGYQNRQDCKYDYLTSDLDTSEEEEESNTRDQESMNRNSSSDEHQVNYTSYSIMNKIFDKLVDRGANFKHISGTYQTLVHHAVKRSNKYIVEKLIHLGLDLIDPDCYGNLPIHYVSDIDIFNILKQHKQFSQTISTKNKNGETVLHIYVRSKIVSIDLCSELILHNVDVNSVDNVGNSPLHNVQSTEACKVLINFNADLNMKNKAGQTPAHVALTMGNFEIAAFMLKQPSLNMFILTDTGKSYLTIFSALTDSYFEKIKGSLDDRKEELDRLIELYCNETDDDGVSNLFHATNNKYLLPLLSAQKHIQVNVPESKHNNLLLHCVHGDKKLAKFFVDHGLDVNKVDVHLRTPLLEAITGNQNDELVKYLIEAGADVNFIGWQGTTPLHVACTYLNFDAILTLLEAGADFRVRDNSGKLPLQHLPIEYHSIIEKIIF